MWYLLVCSRGSCTCSIDDLYSVPHTFPPALGVLFFFFFLIYVYLFIYCLTLFILRIYFFWLHWVFIAVHGISLVAASGGYSWLQCAGFSLQWLLLLRRMGCRRVGFSRCGSWALECRLSSCGTWAYSLHGIWDLP